VPGEKVVMERNEQYWEDGLPYIDRVEIITIAEAATQVNALLSGQIDLLPQCTPSAPVGQFKVIV
jgi:peptide/nickel transport system substrate-binding protein